MTVLDITILMPEIILAVFGFILLIFGAACGDRVTRGVAGIAILAFIIAGANILCPMNTGQLVTGVAASNFAFNNMFVDNAFTRFAKLIILASSALSILLSLRYNEEGKLERFEYPVLIIFATIGMMLMVSASDFLALYVGLELQSLALYVLASFQRDDAKSSEAGLKYFVLGALSSGVLLYGISLIYGYAGTTEFVNLAFALKATPVAMGVVIGMVFVAAGLAFKISAVPFHMWTPDVYEGAPTPVAAFFSAAPKIAALGLMIHVLYLPFVGISQQWQQIVVFLAVASMLLGCFAGVVQTNVKRLMAYSSIANVGFMLVGVAAFSPAGIKAVLFYLAIYFLNTLGAFGVILCLRRNGKQVEQITDFSGLSKSNPLLALAMVIFMFSMAGVPPLAGFFGKYFVLLSAVQAHMTPLAIIGVLASVVSAFYYLRIVKVMYFDEVKEPLSPMTGSGVPAVVLVSAVCMLLFTIWPNQIVESAAVAARSLTSY